MKEKDQRIEPVQPDYIGHRKRIKERILTKCTLFTYQNLKFINLHPVKLQDSTRYFLQLHRCQ